MLRKTYLDGAFWCSGVLSLLDYDGTVKYVWNPYSLGELKAKLGDLDVYLECVASKNDGSCTAPSDHVFEAQQIPLLSVYQSCLSSYDLKVWNLGAYLLFNRTLQAKYKLNNVPEVLDPTFGKGFDVGKCLNEANANEYSNDACFDMFLGGANREDVFVYTNITAANPTSAQQDACLTFSGPAAHPDPRISVPFIACLESFANRSGCGIPAVVWSGRSKNKLPIATPHTLLMKTEDRLRYAMGEVEATRATVLAMVDKIEREFTGDGIVITLFSAEADSLHQLSDCVMQGPMKEMVFTPGPAGVETVRWSRSSGEGSREFTLPCSGEALTMRNGVRDTKSPFTCGTPARRAILKHFLRTHLGGGTNNSAAKDMVLKAVRRLINDTRAAWSYDGNFRCTCRNGTTGWHCCLEQSNCATEACPCPSGYSVPQSVACCDAVCPGLAGAGIMGTFTSINGSTLAHDLLVNLTEYLRASIWTTNEPWLKYDPMGLEAYQASWRAQAVKLADAGLFDPTQPVVYYDETISPFQHNATMWDFCAGLMRQVMWTMPIDRGTDRPRMRSAEYDPINGESKTLNITYKEEFIQALTQEAFRKSPLYWTYAARYMPSPSEVCARTTARKPTGTYNFTVGAGKGLKTGFSSYTLGGVGVDCHCGWWNPADSVTCRIPDATCARLVQLLGFNRICITQQQVYSPTDHDEVLSAMAALLEKDPAASYACPSLQVSEHWGLMGSDGLPFTNATDTILNEGASGWRVGNAAWLEANQRVLVNPTTRVDPVEKASQQCTWTDGSIADHFIDELFPAAQGVRQSAPQSYCTRYGIELARQTVFQTMNLDLAVAQQQAVVDLWRTRCQYKLEQVAVCKAFQVLNATGAPQGTSQCPFSIQATTALQKSYAVTPGCLLVLWDSSAAGIYDPCVCVACAGQVVQVPGALTSSCKLQDLDSIVGDGVVPGEVGAVPLGSGSFLDLMNRQGRFKVNTLTSDIKHWAIQTSMLDADYLQDWWPDEWRHPAGYHVTPGCSLTGDAHWKTFNASWRWDSLQEAFVFEPEVADPLLRRNAFGASGVCRSTNYGMPMHTLNTMRVCTKENRNAKADPTVPPPSAALPWLDGDEFCSESPLATPWNWTETLNPPRQWSVGTMMRDILEPFHATEWGGGCGPYPLRTCVVDGDCATGLKCLTARGTTGVCGKMAAGSFQCAIHSHCSATDQLCSGDGLCVDGVWLVKNSLDRSVSFRTHSQTCPTGDSLDTWGTSTAELVPDILNASGLCSYRSWYENKKMAERNQCTNTDTCASFTGMFPWNFTSPSVLTQSDAFSDGVLKVRPSSCDRSYQHLDGFVSCTPSDYYFQLRSASGNVVSKPAAGYARANRTRTYKPWSRSMPLMHHLDTKVSATYGFTGVPLTYKGLGFGSASPSLMACRSLKVCGLQNEFRVNGVVVAQRQVIDNSVKRGYTVSDLIKCGVFGFQMSSGACRLDYAVVPLASLFLSTFTTWKTMPGFTEVNTLTDTYSPDDAIVKSRLAMLNKLPGLILQHHIGGSPATLQDYVTNGAKFTALFVEIKKLNVPSYAEAGAPKQLYYLTQYGAYEVPFAWWFKCAWIAGFPMGTSIVDAGTCGWNTEGVAAGRTTFVPYDDRLSALFNLPASATVPYPSVVLRALLVKLPGLVMQTALTAVLADYKAERDAWYNKVLGILVRKVGMKCFKQQNFKDSISARSSRYQTERINQAYDQGGGFDMLNAYLDDVSGLPLCTGASCVESVDFSTSLNYNSNFSAMLESALRASAVSLPSVSLDSTAVPDTDGVTLTTFQSADVPQAVWSGMLSAFDYKADGCAFKCSRLQSSCPSKCLCGQWSDCSASVQQGILQRQNMPSPQPLVQPLVKVLNAANVVKSVTNVCGPISGNLVCGATCTVVNNTYADAVSVELPPGVEMETYQQVTWPCTTVTCADTSNPLHGTTILVDNLKETPLTTVEQVVLGEYTYTQQIGGARRNPWVSATELRERSFLSEYQSQGDLVFDARCKDRGGYPCFGDRGVAHGGNAKLTVRTLKYYVNSKLKSTITFHPCGNETTFSATWLALRATYPRASAIPGFQCETIGGGRRPGVNMYVRTHVRLAVPANSTVPSSDPDFVLGRVRTIVGNLEAALDDEDESCLDPLMGGCSLTVDASASGTMTARDWTEKENQDKCTSLKADPVLGCSMYPGEATWSKSRCVNIHTTTAMDVLNGVICMPGSWSTEDQFRDPDINGCGCDDYWRFYHPYIADCLTSDATDTCKGSATTSDAPQMPVRDMRLVGRATTYTYRSISIPCTGSPIRQCNLLDEASTYASTPMGVCSGDSGDSFALARRTAYANLLRSDKLNTVIRMDVKAVGTGESVSVSPFDHMYLGLQPQRSDKRPAYVCGACLVNGVCTPCSTQETPVCSGFTIPVEMRSNLWTCLNCPLVTAKYCMGDHRCMLTSPELPLAVISRLDGWNNLSADAQSFLWSSSSQIDTAIQAVRWLVNQSASLGVPAVNIPYTIPEFMVPGGNYQTPYTYNPLPVLRFNDYMLATASTCGSTTGLLPDFTNCSYDSHRQNLRQFARVNYKVADGIVLNPSTSLLWKVTRSQMMKHNIPAWEGLGNKSGMFVTDVFDDSWCMWGNMNDNICYRRGTVDKVVVDVLNPGLLGAFEPLAGCDVELRDYSRVVSSQCRGCDGGANTINDIESGETMLCNDGLAVAGVSESMQAKSNLCGKTPDYSSQCSNLQGILSRAQAVFDGGDVGDLYARKPWSMVNSLPAGLRDNVLFQGSMLTDDVTLSNLALSPYDIGGHYLSMVLANTTGSPVLKIVGMPLGSYSDPLSDIAYGLGQTTSSNLKWLTIQEAVEVDALRVLYPNPVCSSWDCPLRRRAFYHGNDASFRPMVPDPFRTQVLYGSKAHPTQRASLLGMSFATGGLAMLGAYKTYNGFCACRSPPCTACPTDYDALMGGWRASSVLAGGECVQQMDWPYPGGLLRDVQADMRGTSRIPERFTSTSSSCGLLNRLPAFQYRYKNSETIVRSSRTTLDRGGVCAMGWPVIYAGPLTGCYLLVDRDTFMCTGMVERQVVRMKARTLASLLYSTTRTRLADCRMPPSYRFPSGTSTASEVSYGQLKRLETSRLLAVDIRRRLCGNATTCAATKDWSLATFWASVFVKDLPTLIPASNNSNATLWDAPWVACMQDKNGSMDCDGTVTRDEWLSPKTRGPACIKALEGSKHANELTRSINVCDLDSTLDLFCRTIQDGRYQVYEANCKYSGQCRQQLFFYQPSTYVVDNGEFARSTVQTFYNYSVAGACVPDMDTAAALEETARALQGCAAIQLNTLVDCIHIIRLIVDSLVELVYLVCELFLYLFQLIGQSGSKAEATNRQINALMSLIKSKFLVVFNQFGNLLYRIVMTGPMGQWLEGAIQKLCQIMNTFVSGLVYAVLCFVRVACISFLQVVAKPIVNVLATVSFGSLNYLKDDVNRAVGVIKEKIRCDMNSLLSCNIDFAEDDKPTSVLPAATRCWAGVEPGIGSLGCTAADTCLGDDFTLMNCAVCQGASSMIKFGCNTLTKLCSCNVFPTGVSSCMSHEECTMDSDDVDCQYVDSYLEPSYGNVPCRQCAYPICLISDGSGVGQCSCLLRPVSHQACSIVGQRVSPNAAQLCLVAITAGASSAVGNTDNYRASFRTLASVPCLLLNQAQTYCLQVYDPTSLLVVGRSLLQSRRRRLLEETRLVDVPLLSNVSAWEGEGEPCRALIVANDSQLGILERYVRSECWRWRDVGAKIVADENMTRVSPYFLVSWRDFLNALLMPDSILDITAKLPSIIDGLLLHSEVTQPLYVAVLYWTRLIPEEMWSNASFLDRTRDFFINHTTLFRYNGPTVDQPIPTPIPAWNNTTSTRRRLLVSAEMAYEWSKGPYQWPPNYQYWDNSGKPSCAVVSTAINVFKNALNTTVVSYRVTRPDSMPIVWPTIVPMRVSGTISVNTSSLEAFMAGLTDAWLDKDAVRGFVNDAPWLPFLKSLIKCDFEAIQTCSHRHSLFWSAIQTAVFFVGISLVARMFGVPYVDFALALLFVPWVMYTAYGYAITCAPLIPACMLEDMFDLFDWLLPSSIDWPPELVTREGCTAIHCMRSCRYDSVVGFASAEDHLAWAACEFDVGFRLASALPAWSFLDPLRASLHRKCALWGLSESMRYAQRTCWTVTVVNSTPILLLLLAALSLVPVVVGVAVAVVQFALTTVVSLLLFAHSSGVE